MDEYADNVKGKHSKILPHRPSSLRIFDNLISNMEPICKNAGREESKIQTDCGGLVFGIKSARQVYQN